MTDLERVLEDIHRDARQLALGDEDVARVMTRFAAGTRRRRRPRARWFLVLAPIAALVAGATWAATRPSTANAGDHRHRPRVVCRRASRRHGGRLGGGPRPGRGVRRAMAPRRHRSDHPRGAAADGLRRRCGQPLGRRLPNRDAGVCRRLGGEPLPADYADVGARLAGLRALAQSNECHSPEQARAAISAELARIGADDWTVSIRRVPDAAPCVAVMIDGDRRAVAILELARGPAPSRAAAARDRAWMAVLAEVERVNPGWPERGRPDPAATLAIVRRKVAGTVLASTPVVIDPATAVTGLGFNPRLRCADITLAISGDRAEQIALVPHVQSRRPLPDRG